MPRLDVKTTAAKEVWKSPDGQRKIYELVMDYKGKPVKAQTFSEKIAEVGWTGEVESYERGNHTFVRQTPKEDGYAPRSSGGTTNSSTSKYVPKDEKAIQAMWATGQAVQLVVATKPKDLIGQVEAYAQELFLMVDRVKVVAPDVPDEPETPTESPEPDVVHDPEQTSIEDIKDIFSDAEKAAEEVKVEDPWQPS